MIDICLCGIAREDCDYHKPVPIVTQLPVYDVPVYDVSGTCFIAGVTNFTAENLYAASISIASVVRKVIVHCTIHYNLRRYSLLNSLPDGTEEFQGFGVVSNPNFPETAGVFDSLLSYKDGKGLILRTREF